MRRSELGGEDAGFNHISTAITYKVEILAAVVSLTCSILAYALVVNTFAILLLTSY